MSQDRLVGLATVSIEKTIAENLDLTEVIEEFASAQARKAYSYWKLFNVFNAY